MIVCLMTVLAVIRYWLVSFVNDANQRNRYTVVITNDNGVYTITGANINFVPAEEYDRPQGPLGTKPSVFDLRKDATGLRRKKDD